MMFVFDTNVIGEILKREHKDPRVVDWFISLPAEDCRTTSINVAELMYGVALLPMGHRRDALSRTVRAFVATYATRTLNFDCLAAAHYAGIVASRRAQGRPIGVQDAMIAAIARSRGAVLATRNVKDFDSTGVEVVDPWERVA